MRVNSAFTGFFRNRIVVGFGIALLMLAIVIVTSSFTKNSDRELRARQTNLIIRQLGHQLLLQAGDTKSQVLPVTEIKEGTFILRFEKDFVFSHDSLMALSQKLFPKTQFPSGYTVTVHECLDENIVYGFQVNSATPDILPCVGRKQPKGCYLFEFAFPDFYKTDYPLINLFYGGVLVLSFVLLVGRFGRVTTHISAPKDVHPITIDASGDHYSIGKFVFEVKSQRLLFEKDTIELTDKECKVLELLSKNFGELIPRENLMQEVWINEGVITGRSLDMFVSKLRKKLSGDSRLRITNVHGKGYKLELIEE